MSRAAVSAAAVLSLATVGLAQTTRVVPAIYANTEGNDIGSYPFGWGAFRSQQIVDGTKVATASAILRSLSLRSDNDNSIGSKAVTFSNVTVNLSATTVTPAAMSTTFASNVTGTPMTVFQGQLSLPAYTSSSGGVAPWSFTIPFSTPFVFTVASGNLLVDIAGNGANPVSPQVYIDCALPGGAFRSFGQTGPLSQQDTLMGLRVSASGTSGRFSGLIPGGSVVVFAQSQTTAFSGLMMLGTSKLSQPISLAGLGAPGNFLYTLPIVTLPFTMTQSIGGFRGTVNIGVPNQMGFVGLSFVMQAYVIDPPANQLGIVTTNAVEVTVGDPNLAITNQVRVALDTATSGSFQYVSGILGGPVMQLGGTFN